ncbi:hypothetical protein WJX84_000472 [Apatococcus fuscideae]|uniref:Cyclic nucleotide-binding domain-containing protein n=1 Tax=Apatococcus fuscideae TaxID=2026836 RepID=A0AAW1TJ78_9CHLO
MLPVLGTDPGTGWQVFPVLTNAFFVADILVNFMTGTVDSQNRVHYQLLGVWKAYLTSWFLIDIIACLPLECILANAATHVNFYNTPKLIRLLRAVGIRRRCGGDPFRWVDRISTKRREFSYSAKRLVTTALLLCGVVHYFACLLWWTVRLQEYPDITWPVQIGIVDAIVPVQWLWSIFNIVSAMIGLSYGPFPPRTWGEALVFLIAMVTVAVLFAVFNGFILAAILYSSGSRHRIKKRMDDVLEMTRLRNLPSDMRTQILDYFMYKYREGQLEETDGLLHELPHEMQVRVAIQSTGGLLTAFPFFAKEEQLLKRVALLLRPMYALAGEELITQGWPTNQMFFVRNSTGYVDMVATQNGQEQIIDTVGGGSCFGEAALLPLPSPDTLQQELRCVPEDVSNYNDTFTATCTARALTNLDMFVLEAEDFHKMADHYPRVFTELKQIAIRHAGRVQAKKDKSGRPALPLGSWEEPSQRLTHSCTFPLNSSTSLSLEAGSRQKGPQPSKPLPTIADISFRDLHDAGDPPHIDSQDPLLSQPRGPHGQPNGDPSGEASVHSAAAQDTWGACSVQSVASIPRQNTSGSLGALSGLPRLKAARRPLPPRDLWEQLAGRSSPRAPTHPPFNPLSSGGPSGAAPGLPPSGLARAWSGSDQRGMSPRCFDRRTSMDEKYRRDASPQPLSGLSQGPTQQPLSRSSSQQADRQDSQVRNQSDSPTQPISGLSGFGSGRTQSGLSGSSPRRFDRRFSLEDRYRRESLVAPAGLQPPGSSSSRDNRLIDPQPAAHIQLPIRSGLDSDEEARSPHTPGGAQDMPETPHER